MWQFIDFGNMGSLMTTREKTKNGFRDEAKWRRCKEVEEGETASAKNVFIKSED